MVVSGIVLTAEIPEALRGDLDLWGSCLSGATVACSAETGAKVRSEHGAALAGDVHSVRISARKPG